MPFPISYTKEKTIQTPLTYSYFRQDFMELVGERLKNNAFVLDYKENDKLEFRGQLFRFVWNGFSFLNGISGGRLQLINKEQQITIRYTLRFYEAFGLALLFSIIPFLFHFIPQYAAGLFLLIWGVFAGGNYVLGFLSFKGLVKKLLREIRRKEELPEAAG